MRKKFLNGVMVAVVLFMSTTSVHASTVYDDVLKEVGLVAVSELSVTSQPKEYTGKVNDIYTVTVGAKGDGLKYQWETSTDGGKNWSNSTYGGNNTNSMSLYAYENRNGQKFRCRISDATGNTVYSNIVTLVIFVRDDWELPIM